MKTNDKYGVPTTFRIPSASKERLIQEADKNGMNLSQYLESMLVAPLGNGIKNKEEINKLQKENEQLKSEVKRLKQDMFFLTEERKNTIHILVKNESILKELFTKFKEEKFDISELTNKGFNFSYATHKASEVD